jgi:hypothetical protein
MLTIRGIDPTQTLVDDPRLTPQEWHAFCRARGLVAFAAENEGVRVGFAAAESDAKAVHVISLEGEADICFLLLRRLVLLAGERDMSGWVPVDRPDLGALFEGLGFFRSAPGEPGGRPSAFYYWCRNDDV